MTTTDITINNRPGHATLTSLVTDERFGDVVWLVTPDQALAGHFGCQHHADQLIGGLYKTDKGAWQITAYTDRDHLDNYQGPVYYLPSARTRAQAVRYLLIWWWFVSRAEKDAQATLDPFKLTAEQRRNLFR